MKVAKTISLTAADGRLVMSGPSGTHSVLLSEPSTDNDIGFPRARAAIHLIGYLERNGVDYAEITRAVTHVLQYTVDCFGPRDTFCHAEYRRGLRAAFGLDRKHRRGFYTYESVGFRAGLALRPYTSLSRQAA